MLIIDYVLVLPACSHLPPAFGRKIASIAARIWQCNVRHVIYYTCYVIYHVSDSMSDTLFMVYHAVYYICCLLYKYGLKCTLCDVMCDVSCMRYAILYDA